MPDINNDQNQYVHKKTAEKISAEINAAVAQGGCSAVGKKLNAFIQQRRDQAKGKKVQ